MSKKIVVIHKKRGCLWSCGVILLVCFAIVSIIFALCIAAGVALWFLIRYIWRRLCVEAPDSGIVNAGKKLPPIGRKVLAGIVCAFVSLCLIGALYTPSAQTQQLNQGQSQLQTEQGEIEKTEQEDEPEKSDDAASDATSSEPASGQSSDKQDEDTEEKEPEAEPEVVNYADDDVVNDFIAAYNASSASPITDIDKGNIRTKYFGYSYGYYLELLHANDSDKIKVTITETNENADAGVAGMRDVFHDIAKTVDPSLTDDEIYAYFDGLISGGVQSSGTKLGSMEISYSPDIELSAGHSRGHIEIAAQ